MISELSNAGIVNELSSPFLFHILFVTKPDGENHLGVDFRKLNINTGHTSIISD